MTPCCCSSALLSRTSRWPPGPFMPARRAVHDTGRPLFLAIEANSSRKLRPETSPARRRVRDRRARRRSPRSPRGRPRGSAPAVLRSRRASGSAPSEGRMSLEHAAPATSRSRPSPRRNAAGTASVAARSSHAIGPSRRATAATSERGRPDRRARTPSRRDSFDASSERGRPTRQCRRLSEASQSPTHVGYEGRPVPSRVADLAEIEAIAGELAGLGTRRRAGDVRNRSSSSTSSPRSPGRADARCRGRSSRRHERPGRPSRRPREERRAAAAGRHGLPASHGSGRSISSFSGRSRSSSEHVAVQARVGSRFRRQYADLADPRIPPRVPPRSRDRPQSGFARRWGRTWISYSPTAPSSRADRSPMSRGARRRSRRSRARARARVEPRGAFPHGIRERRRRTRSRSA